MEANVAWTCLVVFIDREHTPHFFADSPFATTRYEELISLTGPDFHLDTGEQISISLQRGKSASLSPKYFENKYATAHFCYYIVNENF